MKIQKFNFRASDQESDHLLQAVEKLFEEIKIDVEKSQLINEKNHSVNAFLFEKLASLIVDSEPILINAFLLKPNQYLLKFAVIEHSNLDAIFTIIADNENGKIKFSSPIEYRTRHWQNKQIGNVRYCFKGYFNEKLAAQFDRKNTEIAIKFDVPIKQLDFYKCSNYEEVLHLLGIDFDSQTAGVVQSCEDFENTIITGVNSENYCHDLFHMYIVTKFPDDDDRNFIAEEGYANSIADAYYAKLTGEIITREELIIYLKEYMENKPQADLLKLFQEDPRVYFQLSEKVSGEVFNELSVKSTIVSLICDEVERIKGFEGLIKLLRCGKGEDNFFVATSNLIGLDKSNFNKRTRKMLLDF